MIGAGGDYTSNNNNTRDSIFVNIIGYVATIITILVMLFGSFAIWLCFSDEDLSISFSGNSLEKMALVGTIAYLGLFVLAVILTLQQPSWIII